MSQHHHGQMRSHDIHNGAEKGTVKILIVLESHSQDQSEMFHLVPEWTNVIGQLNVIELHPADQKHNGITPVTFCTLLGCLTHAASCKHNMQYLDTFCHYDIMYL